MLTSFLFFHRRLLCPSRDVTQEERSKARAGRATSNVFAKMSKKMMQEMKEVGLLHCDLICLWWRWPMVLVCFVFQGKKRATSNVFAMFRQAQVQEFKEV